MSTGLAERVHRSVEASPSVRKKHMPRRHQCENYARTPPRTPTAGAHCQFSGSSPNPTGYAPPKALSRGRTEKLPCHQSKPGVEVGGAAASTLRAGAGPCGAPPNIAEIMSPSGFACCARGGGIAK